MTSSGNANALTSVLLSFGGSSVFLDDSDSAADELVRRGVLEDASGMVQFQGKSPQCHANTALMVHNGWNGSLHTGYALTVEGVWLAHSWLVNSDGCIVETIPSERFAYFGYALTVEEVEDFLHWNY